METLRQEKNQKGKDKKHKKNTHTNTKQQK